MKIITISREFGSGGRELGKRLADLMQYDYYDSEIIFGVAQRAGLDADYVEKALSNHGWRNHGVTFRTTLGSCTHLQPSNVNLLLEQKKVIEEIAALGKDCVIIGRNADVILRKYNPFNIFVCAETEAKVERCRERAPKGENFTQKELVSKMKEIDKIRSHTREIMSGSAWGERSAYHLIINTTGWEIKDLAPAVREFALKWFGRK